jgi:shikimate dehydrogenase
MASLDLFTLEDLRNWSKQGCPLVPPPFLAVVGDPVAHSKSPPMHNSGLLARGLNGQYIKLHLRPGELREAFGLMHAVGFRGCNCTIPHKKEAMESVPIVEPAAALMDAVNTVRFDADGYHGFNTDGPGFAKALESVTGRPLHLMRTVVFGAGGGAGRAASVQCAMEGVPSLVLLNRTLLKAEELAVKLRGIHQGSQLNVQAMAWDDPHMESIIAEADLIVNGTSLGMKQEDPPLFPPEWLRPNHVIFDMVYAGGLNAALPSAARAAGSIYVDGMEMLLHQGFISFRHWFGDPVPETEMRAGLQSALKPLP